MLVAIDQMVDASKIIQENVPEILSLIAIAWGVQLVNMMLGYRLNIFGIIPRYLIGLPGILFSSFLHGSLNHIFMNTIFFFVMACMVSVHGMAGFKIVSISIILISGSLVWLLARRACHVGASSLIMGYWSYVMVKAYFDPGAIDVIAAGVGMYYFGVDLLASVAPGKRGVSVEGHIAGLVAGGITAAFFQPVCAVITTVSAEFGWALSCIML